MLPRLHGREVGHIVFEHRGGQDQHDKRTMAEFRADAAMAVRWSYEWAGKSEPLLWIADAVAGAAMEHVVGRNSRWWAMLAASGRAQLVAKMMMPPRPRPSRSLRTLGPSTSGALSVCATRG